MALIGVLVQFTPLTTVKSADVNTNLSAIQTAFNNSAVLTDVARTIAVTHTFSVSQSFTGGIAVSGAGVSIAAGGLSVTGQVVFGADNAYDVGAVGANRPRTVYVGTSLVAPTVTATTLAGTLSTAAQPNVTSLGALTSVNVSGTMLAGLVALSDTGYSNNDGAIQRGTTYGLVLQGRAGSVSDLTLLGPAGRNVMYVLPGTSTTQWFGHHLFGTDNSYDIGASGSSRPRNVYVAGALNTGGTISAGGTIDTNGNLQLNVPSISFVAAYLGAAQSASALINGSAQGDLCIRANGRNLLFSTDSGASFAFALDSTYATLKRHLVWGTDNTNDIGAAAGNRPRNIYAAGSIFSASSRELKEQIRPTRTDALALVKRTRVVDFRYKRSPERPKIGFIAEDTDELLSGPTRKDFDLNNAIGILLRANQQLLARVEQLEQRAA